MNTHRNSRRLQALAVLTISSALLLAGCGGNDDRGAAGTASSDGTPAAATASASSDPSAQQSQTTFDDAGIQAGSDNGTAPQEDVFNVESPWNVSVLDARIAPGSDAMLEQAKVRTLIGLNGRTQTTKVEDGVYVNTRDWTVPVVADGVPTVVTCRQIQCGDGGEDLTLDIPEGVDPNPLFDGWFTVFDPDTRTAYDLWRARRENDGTISYHFMRTWDLDGPGFNQPGVVSARGSGLPLFAGLIRPGELERGQINHALAISVPGPAANFFIQPASSTDGNNKFDGSLPEGARIRLRADFELKQPTDLEGRNLPMNADRRRYAEAIIKALQTYGAIVVDRAAVPTLYFQRMTVEKGRRPLLNGYELNSIGLDNFSVVDFSDLEKFPFPPDDEIVDPTQLVFGNEDTSATTTRDNQAEDAR